MKMRPLEPIDKTFKPVSFDITLESAEELREWTDMLGSVSHSNELFKFLDDKCAQFNIER
jgi:hypothetical protein